MSKISCFELELSTIEKGALLKDINVNDILKDLHPGLFTLKPNFWVTEPFQNTKEPIQYVFQAAENTHCLGCASDNPHNLYLKTTHYLLMYCRLCDRATWFTLPNLNYLK